MNGDKLAAGLAAMFSLGVVVVLMSIVTLLTGPSLGLAVVALIGFGAGSVLITASVSGLLLVARYECVPANLYR